MLRALDRKMLRDLARIKGQVITIGLVVACGAASFVALRGNYTSILHARDAFYERQRFADVFVHVERAPTAVRAQLERLPGVARAETRIVEVATVLLDHDPLPVPARVVSLPAFGEEWMNALRLQSGRRPEPGRFDEVIALHQFAEAHKLRPGDPLAAVVNGRRRDLRLVGTAGSPEYVIAISSGDLAPDPARFAVLWMTRDALEASFQMEGAWNDASVQLQPGASAPAVIAAVDRLLTPYGTDGAYARDRQPSAQALASELDQLAGMSTFLPVVFLAVAALLVNVVMSRLVHLQRPEIAMLKAVGYSNLQVGAHFLLLVLLVGGAGALAGVGLGAFLGSAMVDLYVQYFKLPDLVFRIDVGGAALAAMVSFTAAAVGAFSAVRRAVKTAPAEAMRPDGPARYSRSIVDRLRLARLVGPSAHMVVRELQRRPLRTLLSVLAIAASTALAVVGGWYYDGIQELIETQFVGAMREDTTVAFVRARSDRAVRELGHYPSVRAAEPIRMVPVRFRAGHRQRDGAVTGYGDIELRTLRDRRGAEVPLPPDGIVLTDVLARILEVGVGDEVELHVREGQRPVRRVPVTGLVDESFGLQGHMTADTLRRLLGEGPLASMALLRVDPLGREALDKRLKETPYVAAVTHKSRLLERFQEQTGATVLVMAFIISVFAAVITVGVVYNNARIALSMRARDLASLRVLGFTRAEISSVLIGEIAVEVLLAIPLGMLFGLGLVHLLASTIDPETYRLPIILTARSYAIAATVTLLAALGSALVVRRRLDRLDLVGVLKARD